MSRENNRVWQLDAYTVALGESAPDGRILARQIAGIGARLLAGTIDCIVQSIFATLAVAAVYWSHPEFVRPQERMWLFIAAVVEWHVLYFMLFEAFTSGRTPGKSIVGLQVVDARTGGRASSLQLLGRNLFRAIDLLPVHYLAAALSMAMGPARQRLGDRIGSTCVIYVRSLVEQLHAANVPASNFSTSDDGYLLQAFVQRLPGIHENMRPFLARETARYFQKKYPAAEPGLVRLYEEEQYDQYLQRLCREETAAAALHLDE
ncbi:MAG: RDD family protein [Candidatus Sumerlaeaceae bacterium]